MLSTSPFGRLNWVDAWKTFRGGLIIALGYLATTGLEALIRDITSGAIDLGEFVVLKGTIMTALSSLLELVRRALTDHSTR